MIIFLTHEKIPTYIINLKHRSDRYKNILNEFEGKSEFDVTIVNAVEDLVGSFGLWKSFYHRIKIVKEKNHKYILMCEDDHMFTEEYQIDKFNDQLKIAASREADVFSGGISRFDRSWRENRDELTVFYDFPLEIRRRINTTNIIENHEWENP